MHYCSMMFLCSESSCLFCGPTVTCCPQLPRTTWSQELPATGTRLSASSCWVPTATAVSTSTSVRCHYRSHCSAHPAYSTHLPATQTINILVALCNHNALLLLRIGTHCHHRWHGGTYVRHILCHMTTMYTITCHVINVLMRHTVSYLACVYCRLTPRTMLGMTSEQGQSPSRHLASPLLPLVLEWLFILDGLHQ